MLPRPLFVNLCSFVIVAPLVVTPACGEMADQLAQAPGEGASRFWYGYVFLPDGRVLRADGDGPTEPKDVKPPPSIYGHDLQLKGCVVTGAHLVNPGNADAPLMDPQQFNAPAPGQNTNNLGPAIGPEPGTNPVEFLTVNVFEYHSDLNNRNGCASNQYVLDYRIRLNRTTGRIGITKDTGLDPNVLGGKSPWPEDRTRPGQPITQTTLPARSLFDGNTSTGAVKFPVGGIVYQGTPQTLQWIDGPGWEVVPDPNSPDAQVLIALIKSQSRGSQAAHGWFCYSGHTVAVDMSTGAPMAPAAAQAMFAAANAAPGASKLQQGAAATLRTPAAQGGFQGNANPEFRDLGCYSY